MAITAGRMTVTTTATQIDGNSAGWSHFHVKNMDTTKDLFVGPSTVTAENGFAVAKLEFFEFDIPPGDSIYLIAASGTVEVAWLRFNA
jgi:hypothetical protein